MSQFKKPIKRASHKAAKDTSLATVLGATFFASAVMPLASAAATRPFVADEVRSALSAPVASYHFDRGRDGDSEGSCGEGDCSDNAEPSSEGSCGEGSCSDNSQSKSSGGGHSKSASEGEGSCGEGRCG